MSSLINSVTNPADSTIPNSSASPLQTATVLAAHTPSGTPKIAAKRSSRAGAPNYSTEDICALLDCSAAEEPLGANHWAFVASRFAEWATAENRPVRDQDSLKNKFYKLANMKKKTGDPSCPEPVRRAKHIARAIHNKCAAMTLGGSSGTEEEAATGAVVRSNSSDLTETSTDEKLIGEPRKKRKTGATGMPSKAKTEQLLLDHIGNMTEHVGSISQSIKHRSEASLSQDDVISIVKKEVAESLKPTNELLAKMNSAIENFVKVAGGPFER